MKTIVIGLGNPILGDDGVGWKVVEEVQRQWQGAGVDFEFLSLGGLGLMEHLIGYQRAILVDSFASEDDLGSILILKLSDLPNYSAYHTASAHDTSLQNAIELGRSMGADLPDDVEVVGISTKHIYNFSEELSPAVAEAVPFAAHIVMDLLGQVIKREEEYQPQG
jgi:hydrogenase maturation protease